MYLTFAEEMKINRALLQKVGIGAIAFLLSKGNAEESLRPSDYAEVAGIHSWLVEIPSVNGNDPFRTIDRKLLFQEVLIGASVLLGLRGCKVECDTRKNAKRSRKEISRNLGP